MAPYRVLVVDDSAFMRKIISDLIVQDSGFTIAATASNGMEAITAAREHQPDVITMDLEMPHMNGLEALQFIMKDNPRPIIMLSGISEDNTRDTIKALQFGAFDFIRKPSAIGSDDIHAVGDQLLEKLRTAAFVKTSKELLAQRKQSTVLPPDKPVKGTVVKAPVSDARAAMANPISSSPKQASARDSARKPQEQAGSKPSTGAGSAVEAGSGQASAQSPIKPVKQRDAELTSKTKMPAPESKPSSKPAPSPLGASIPAGTLSRQSDKPASGKAVPPERPLRSSSADSFRDVVAIGTSTGGPRALHEVICSLPRDFPAPVLVVQHMPPKFTRSLAQRLDSFSPLTVVEAEQGMKVKAGFVYVAPGGFHMELSRQDGGYAIRLGEQPQRNGHRPSVDVMFESLAPFRELNIHAVIMTGMGSDGAKGMKLLAEQGAASLIAEAEETCIVYGMPRSAVEGGFVKNVLPLGQISSELAKAINKTR